MAAILPDLLWFTRNRLLFGGVTLSHDLMLVFFKHKLDYPFRFIWDEILAVQGVPRLIVMAISVALLLLPFLRSTSQRKSAQASILGGAVAHFMIVWLLSLVAIFSELEHRLLSPVFAFGLLAMALLFVYA